MADEDTPFFDVVRSGDGFSLPELKFRELVFVGALRPDGEGYLRDPARPLPPFAEADLFPCGVRFTVRTAGGRVHFRREP